MPESKIVRDPYPTEKLTAKLDEWWITIDKWRELHGIVGLSDLKASERDVLSARLAFDYRFDLLAAKDMLEILSRSGVARLEACLGLLDRIQRLGEPRQAPASLLVSGGLRPSELLRRYFLCCGFRTIGAQIFVYAPRNSSAWRGRRISGECRLDDPIERPGAIEVNSHLSSRPRYSLRCTFDGGEEVVKRVELVVTACDDFGRLAYADFDEQARLLDRFADLMLGAKGLIKLANRLPSADTGRVRSDHDLGSLELSRGVTKNLGRWPDEHHLTLTLQVPDC